MSLSDDYYNLKKKKKKKDEAESSESSSSGSSLSDAYYELKGAESEAASEEGYLSGNIGFVAGEDEEEEDKADLFGLDLYQKGVFDDGYQFGDITKTILGTTADTAVGIAKGVFGLVEGVVDLAAYGVAGVADLVGEDDFAERLKKTTALSQTDAILGGTSKWLDEYSILGDTLEGVAQGIGQVGIILATGGAAGAAGLGTAGTTALTTGIMGASGMGSGMSEAYQGGATDEEALIYGTIAGASDALSELMFGGMGKAVNATGLSVGLSSADDMLAKKASGLFNKQLTKNLAEFGIKAGAEGFEEVVAGTAQAVGKKLTYMSEEELGDILKDENLLEQFVVGAVTSGIAQSGVVPGTKSGSLIEANKTGRDFISGLTADEQSVVDKVYQDRVAQEEKKKKGTISGKEKSKIYDAVVSDFEKGYISTDTIEEVMGGDVYKAYRQTVDSEDALQKEYDTLYKMKNGDKSDEQVDRQAELKQQLEDLKTTSKRGQLYQQLGEKLNLKQNTRFVESYNERARSGQKFEADLTKYNAKQQEIVKKAIDSGIVNNTNKAHEFVDLVAKIYADKGVSFDFVNNEKLKGSSFAVDGAFVNGYYDKKSGTIGVNINSPKALETTVGHEITHVLEGSDVYSKLQEAVFQYAKAKGEYDTRRKYLERLYDPADIDSELTADLVGDYLFTDADFINNLSTNHRNVFQKIYDEIKYLCKVATAGSDEARKLEEVKRLFDKAYRDGSKAQKSTEGGVKNSLGYHAGDLGKAEFYHEQGYGRDTGHFGTGTYFVGDEAKISHGNYGKRPHQSVEFNNYNLYKVKSDKDGYDLHDQLRVLDGGFSQEFYDKAINDEFRFYPFVHKFDLAEQKYKTDTNSWDEAYVPALQEIAETRGIEYQSLEEWCEENGYDPTEEYIESYYNEYLEETIDTETQKIEKEYARFRDAYFNLWLRFGLNDTKQALKTALAHQQELNPNGERDYWTEHDAHADSIATVFMKSLGYEGVDARGTALDNTTFGSVIYDLKGEDLARKQEIGTAKYSLSSETDKEYLDAEDIRYSLSADSDGKQLTKEQQEYFKDSKVRDDDGSLKVVYHGSGVEFTEFSYDFMSTHGSSEGQGFYFTDSENMANGYRQNGAKLMKGYLDIKKPLSDSKVTVKRSELAKLLKAIDPTGDDVLINYDPSGGIGYPSQAWYNRALAGTVDSMLRYNESDSEILADIANSGAGTEVVVRTARSLLGYDGYIVSGKYDGATVYVAFESNQFKNIDNLKPTSNPDTRYSLSSMAGQFFGNENMSSIEFQEADYKQTEGYKTYVEQCLNNYRQTRKDFDETVARKEIEDSIDGIVRVALAAKKAGYDIYDDKTKRSKRDSKNRLLFSSLEPNSDYFTSSDISTICDKRKNFAEIYDDIVRAEEAKGVPQGKRFFDNVDNYFYLHSLMAEKGLTQPCRQCYVESMRKNLAPMASAFLRLVGETNPDNKANDQLYQQKGKNKGNLKTNNASTREWVLTTLAEYDMTVDDLTVETLTTEDGLARLKIQAPMIYEAFNSFYGQSKPKMPKSATPFRFGELTALLTDEHGKIKRSLVDKINSTGGFRLQSYSDFQIQNYTDVLQVIYEAGTLGLTGHAYTKVPAFLDATEGTNLKRNISIFMYKDGDEWKLDRNDSFPYTLEEIYEIVKADKSGNTSIIAVSQNEDMSAWIMANDLVGYGIPFHKSGLKMGVVRDTIVKEDGREIKGYSGTKDHTKQQTEVWAKSSEDHKALTKVKNGINIYSFWDFDNKANLSKNELIEKNVKAYIDACEVAGYLPKFREYVINNGKVLNNVLEYSKKLGFASQDATVEDISFEYKGYRIPYGYYKFLGDFGMFTPDGAASSHEVLSLNNYDFDKAVEFFADSETLRRNEILQQFANGEERERYRNSDLSAEELSKIVKQKRGEIAEGVVAGYHSTAASLSQEGVDEPYNYGGRFYGKDIALETAPVQEDLAPVSETDTDVVSMEDYAPMSEEAAEEMRQDMFASITDEDAPPEREAPYRGESQPVTVDNPFDERDWHDVGNRKVKAYMYENPEVKPFFQEEAWAMKGDLERSIKGERGFSAELFDKSNGEQGFYGIKRMTADDIAELLDYGYTYDQIEKGLDAIIEDNGAENNAVSKRIEFMLHDRLAKGYTDFLYGEEIPPNQEYINLLNEKQINEYYRDINDIFMESADDYAPPVAEERIPYAEDIAPVAETAKTAPTEAYEAIKPKPKKQPKLARATPAEQATAQVLTEEPKVDKKKSGIWAKFKNNVLDKGMVFEDLSLATGNRELQARWNSIRYAEGKAQRLMGEGNESVSSLNDIRDEVERTGKTKQFYEYLYHKHNIDRMTLADRYENTPNKPVFGDAVTADVSRDAVAKLEKANPEFKEFAQDVYDYMTYLREQLVEGGVISSETAKLWAEMYPNYVPIRRQGDTGLDINVPLDTGRTGVNAPVKRATGGNRDILPLFDTMGQRTVQTFKAIAKNRFGVELKNTLGTTIWKEAAGVDESISSVDGQDSLLQEGKHGQSPTFTVFENGEKVTFEITEEMYDAMKPTSDGLAYTNKALNAVNNFRRGTITEYNPWFLLKNAVKDVQDVLINSQHARKTYAAIPKAINEMLTDGHWYQEYMANGGEQNTYFDNQTNTFTKENTALETAKKMFGLNAISKANNVVELMPRLAEYIASREAGRSVDVAMLDAARVTTNFAAGGDLTKFLNRNGATFLNASVQGAMQQVRNIREAKMNGLRGWAGLAGKFILAGLPAMLLNGLLWDDDEEYEELSDYVNQNYYIVGKYGDGQFVRIPKGRTVAVIQNAFEQMGNAITGDDEADLKTFIELVVSNLAPNNPIENNIFSPIIQVANNKTWYGEDLVPTRLQDLPAAEQYDESTDSISRWLGETFDISPYKANYLLDQYSGVIGDTFLPMLTPEAESGDNTVVGNITAPLKDMFTTDSVMNNQNVSDFYDTKDELTTNAKASGATDEDVLKSKYINSVNSDLSKLYALKREVQNSDLDDERKYAKVREIQNEIVALTRESLSAYEDVSIEGEYARVGDRYYRMNDDGEWQKLSDKQLEKQEEVTEELGISGSDYWSNKSEYDFAYEYPEKYAVAKSVGGYDSYKSYNSELYDIKADKDENGKTINGSRKEKVIDYVNNLDVDYGIRLILFKNEYNADDTYNYEIIDYLNSREDISYEEMETILKELGFTVSSDGTISW